MSFVKEGHGASQGGPFCEGTEQSARRGVCGNDGIYWWECADAVWFSQGLTTSLDSTFALSLLLALRTAKA
jgi:hypothetical protein